uniref:Secreted protein n=1 Tax=Peronospora matthiolae TaxID=2874970 RepID=A0AAV1VLP2_9STRA
MRFFSFATLAGAHAPAGAGVGGGSAAVALDLSRSFRVPSSPFGDAGPHSSGPHPRMLVLFSSTCLCVVTIAGSLQHPSRLSCQSD